MLERTTERQKDKERERKIKKDGQINKQFQPGRIKMASVDMILEPDRILVYVREKEKQRERKTQEER